VQPRPQRAHHPGKIILQLRMHLLGEGSGDKDEAGVGLGRRLEGGDLLGKGGGVACSGVAAAIVAVVKQ
jgi:hypothetical protein